MIPDNNTQLDWGLDEPLRFPVTASSWSPQLTIPNVDLLDIQPSGAHFASVIKPRKPRETYATLAKLIDAFPEDFELAAAAITPAGWRQLYYRGTYVLECLSSPRFHPDQELRRICELPEHFDDAPPEWLGTTDLLQDLASDTCYSIRQIGAGAARAVWAVLSAAQAIPLSKSEVLHVHFWDPDWIRRMSGYLNQI